jgi:hypothetical protein
MLQGAIDLDRCYKQPPSRCEERDNSAKAAFHPTPLICEPKMDGGYGAGRPVQAGEPE